MLCGVGAERTFAFDLPTEKRVFFLLRMMSSMNSAYEVSADGAVMTDSPGSFEPR